MGKPISLLSIVLILISAVACVPQLKLKPPFLVLHFEDVDLVIEDASSVDVVVRVLAGDVSFSRIQQSKHYSAEGSGTFDVRGNVFTYSSSSVTREGGLDKSLGAILIGADGSLRPVNPLPLLAK
jgi:hypothetical protein